MTDRRLSYTDAETLREMAVDCHEVEHNLHLPPRSLGLGAQGATEYLGEPAPPSARVRSRYEVSDDLARLADGLQLHFD